MANGTTLTKLLAGKELTIEQGIPIPPRRSNPSALPFGNMAVGDSVLLPGIEDSGMVSPYVSFWKRTKGWKFTTRKVEGGVRVWRTE